MTKHKAELMRYMEQLRQFRGTPPEGYVYAGMEDFLIREGAWYEPAPLPPSVQIGVPQSCFSNALALAILHGYTYVEGLAIAEIGIPLPTHHAWNVDATGRLIDSTWIEYPGLAYRGVQFNTGRADHSVWIDNALGIFDDPAQWKQLYRSRWYERWDKTWPRSKFRRELERTKIHKQLLKGLHDAALR